MINNQVWAFAASVALLSAVTSAIPSQGTSSALIEGAVVEIDSRVPIVGATVELIGPVNGRVQTYTQVTDKDGRFVFENLPRATGYWLAALVDGYAKATYGQQDPNAPGLPINLTAGQSLRGIKLLMVRAGEVSGRVVDRAGKPLSNARVEVLRPWYAGGLRLLLQSKDFLVSRTTTDADGHYRVAGLTPGHYFLSAISSNPQALLTRTLLGKMCEEPPPTTASMGVLGISTERFYRPPEGYLPMFFPGKTDPASAEIITVRPGANLNLTELKITAVAPKRVQGEVVNAKTGRRVRSGQVTVLSSTAGSSGHSPCTVEVRNGSFSLPSLLQGSYLFLADVKDASSSMRGYVLVDVQDSDLKNISIPVHSDYTLRGRIRIEGIENNSPDSGGFAVSIDRTLPSMTRVVAQISAQSQRDGMFLLQGATAGDYRVHVRIPDDKKDWYVQDMRLGATRISKDLKLGKEQSEELEIVVSPRGGSLDGQVVNANGPVAGAAAVLVPKTGDSANIKVARTGVDGRFEMRGLAPGDYALFAWVHLQDREWEDPEILRVYKDYGRAIRINPGETVTSQVDLLTSWK
jgi:hypothetical protein